MVNSVMLVGRLVDEPISEKISEDKEATYIVIAIPRNFKNADGEYESDFVDITLWQGIADNVKEYCHKGDLVGIRGRIQTTIEEDKTKRIDIIAEKMTFLSSQHKDTE